MIPVHFAGLLKIDHQTAGKLAEVKLWARANITRLKRRRKYLPRGAGFTPEEAALLRALFDLEAAAGALLKADEKGGDMPKPRLPPLPKPWATETDE